MDFVVSSASADVRSHFISIPVRIDTSIHTKAPPVELIDYDSKIKQAQDRIVAIAEQQQEVKQKAIDVLESLDGVAKRVGSSFAMVWTHVSDDTC